MSHDEHHVRYPKIDEETRAWAPDPATARWLHQVRWYVTEKVHGAHFEMISDGARVWFAKRGAPLAPGEAFFWHHRATAHLEDNVRALARAALQREEAEGARAVHVHGELFGGAYPHPEVEAAAGVQAIQTGVYYCPDVRFCAYDIALSWSDGGIYWLDFEEVLSLLAAHGLDGPPVLSVGTWAEATARSLDLQSAVPARLGLPPLTDNLAEGVVIRAAREVGVPTASGALARPILKRKHPRFMEDARYHQAQAPKETPGALPPLAALEWEALSRLNPNRLAAARSKLGQAPDPQAWAAEAASDIWAALATGCADLLARLSAEDRALLRAVLDDEALTTVLQAIETPCGDNSRKR